MNWLTGLVLIIIINRVKVLILVIKIYASTKNYTKQVINNKIHFNQDADTMSLNSLLLLAKTKTYSTLQLNSFEIYWDIWYQYTLKCIQLLNSLYITVTFYIQWLDIMLKFGWFYIMSIFLGLFNAKVSLFGEQ